MPDLSSSEARHDPERPADRRAGLVAALGCCLLTACGGDQSPSRSGQTADTRLRIARAAATGGDPELAAAMYGAAAEGGQADVALQLKAADGLGRNGDIAGAEETLKRALQANPGQTDLLRAIGLAHVAEDRPEQAIIELDRVLAARPNDAGVMMDKAVALDLMHRHAEAQSLYRKALAITPHDMDISNDLAVSMMLQGRLRDAEAVLAPLQSADTSSERMKNNLAVVYAASGDAAKARRLTGDGVSAQTLKALAQALPKGVNDQ